ncbi:wax ester/triacylglycerol synthase domain-containing protein, partial [Tessaracoccus lubricantis]
MVHGSGPRPANSLHRRGGGERLSGADASNIEIDSPQQVNVFLLAGLLGIGGFVMPGGIDMATLRAALAARLAGPVEGSTLVRFAQRVEREVRSLVWRDCWLDLQWHVRLTDPVDGCGGFEDMVATLMTRPLPMDRPRWEMLVVPGAGPEGPGVVLRVHHSVVDGVAGVRLAQDLFGEEPPSRATSPEAVTAPRRPWVVRLRHASRGARRVGAVFRASVPRT